MISNIFIAFLCVPICMSLSIGVFCALSFLIFTCLFSPILFCVIVLLVFLDIYLYFNERERKDVGLKGVLGDIWKRLVEGKP